jgi:hypothetical protein
MGAGPVPAPIGVSQTTTFEESEPLPEDAFFLAAFELTISTCMVTGVS